MEISDSSHKRIFLDALMTYADSCTQPALTPSCPYFRLVDDSATCGEECRGILEENGVSDRPVQSVLVGGLRMTGRAIPKSAVRGSNDFDATQLFLQDRGRPESDQSTAALMLGLRAELARNVLGSSPTEVQALGIWGELIRRDVDMDSVFRGALVHQMAKFVLNRTLIELLSREGFVNGPEILGTSATSAVPWLTLVAAVVAETPDSTSFGDVDYNALRELLGSSTSVSGRTISASEILNRPDVQYVLSESFARRVAEWFIGLSDHSIEAALRADVPTPDLFMALPGRRTKHVGGLWIWERFTATDLQSWTDSSLIYEWRWSRGADTDLASKRTLSERLISSDILAATAMQSMDDDAPPAKDLFHPGRYVQIASDYLQAGEWKRATRIFEGIVALRPGDGEAWNNLGFCQLGNDAALALPMLRRGAALQRFVPIISIANQMLALHLLHRDDEALQLARANMERLESHPDNSYTVVWLHPSDEGELELSTTTSSVDYLRALCDHLAAGDCTGGGGDA